MLTSDGHEKGLVEMEHRTVTINVQNALRRSCCYCAGRPAETRRFVHPAARGGNRPTRDPAIKQRRRGRPAVCRADPGRSDINNADPGRTRRGTYVHVNISYARPAEGAGCRGVSEEQKPYLGRGLKGPRRRARVCARVFISGRRGRGRSNIKSGTRGGLCWERGT